MKKIYYKIICGLILVVSFSCVKETPVNTGDVNAISKLKTYPIKGFTIPITDTSIIRNRFGSGNVGNSEEDLIGGGLNKLSSANTVSSGPGDEVSVIPKGNEIKTIGLPYGKAVYIEEFEANAFTNTTAINLSVFPGAIWMGNSVGEDIDFSPRFPENIGPYYRPISLSVSIPTSPGNVATVNMPKPSTSLSLVRDALKSTFPTEFGAASFKYEMSSFGYYSELKELYGYNTNTDVFFYHGSSEEGNALHQIKRKSGIKVKFYQENFTVDMDIPDEGQLFDAGGTDVSTIFGSWRPYYVSSVVYGRMGIMTIESDAEQTIAEQAFRKQFNLIKLVSGGEQLTQEEKQIIESADIRLSFIGVNGEDAVQTIKGIDKLNEMLKKGATYDMNSPGVPISFSLKYLDNHQLFKCPFEVRYGEFDMPYARIELKNRSTSQGSDGHGPIYEYNDVYLSFYQDTNCVVPSSDAYNFIKFDYLVETNTTTWYNNASSYDRSVDSLTVQNSNKVLSLLLKQKEVMRYFLRYDEGSSTESIYNYRLISGKGYRLGKQY